jgi:hypothetical protein
MRMHRNKSHGKPASSPNNKAVWRMHRQDRGFRGLADTLDTIVLDEEQQPDSNHSVAIVGRITRSNVATVQPVAVRLPIRGYDGIKISTPQCYAPQTTILEGRTNFSECVFKALFQWFEYSIWAKNVGKCFESDL